MNLKYARIFSKYDENNNYALTPKYGKNISQRYWYLWTPFSSTCVRKNLGKFEKNQIKIYYNRLFVRFRR